MSDSSSEAALDSFCSSSEVALDGLCSMFDHAKTVHEQAGNPSTSNDNAPVETEAVENDDELYEIGGICDVQDLYSSQRRLCDCCVDWVEEKPFEENTEATERAKTKQATFAINRRQSPHGQREWKTHSIVIHSSRIQSFLGNIFQDYPVSYATDTPLILKAGFSPVVHLWDRILDAIGKEEDWLTKLHLELFTTVMVKEIQDVLTRLDLFKKTGVLSFDDIEYIMKPGLVLVNRQDGIPEAGVLQTISKGLDSYYFRVSSIEWNGEDFGFHKWGWRLSHFDGSRAHSELDIFALSLHPDSGQFTTNLTTRGQKFASLCGQSLRAYCGIGKRSTSCFWERSRNRTLNERVMIDPTGYFQMEDEDPPEIKPLTDIHLAKVRSESEPSTNDSNDSDKLATPLKEEHALLAPAWIWGFALQSKIWCRLNISHVRDIAWTHDALRTLVLGEDEKTLITALLNTEGNAVTFDDFIPGKGKGLIMLLCGPPGVGKTLTAESVSEHLKRPLYRLGMGDLSTSVSKLEKCLKRALDRCVRWNAVLLIDEADVFLEHRSTDQLERNELVSIFLRLLEYYEGVMILTTNRSTAIDPAFESRIDITLAYDNLELEARKEIWLHFLSRSDEKAALTEEEIDVVAREVLNGRQIKSAFKTALMIAKSQKSQLRLCHLETVINVRKKTANLLK